MVMEGGFLCRVVMEGGVPLSCGDGGGVPSVSVLS